jgi:two-component system phosphate regulon sensor histidine kinase PhoR
LQDLQEQIHNALRGQHEQEAMFASMEEAMLAYDAQRQKLGAVVMLHDITRLRHLENVRRDFVANVSHELRTPITSIKGFVETLLDGAIEDPDNARRFLRIILRQANRLNAIIEDLLTLSRIEKGSEEATVELDEDSVPEVLQAAVEMCAEQARDKAVTVRLECPHGLTVRMNSHLLEQVVVNLLGNAIKYSDPGLSVELIASRQDNEVVIQVRDHGCGIDPKHLPRLFERFYRVDKARSRELGGTGLAIVKHIALAHHGSASVESAVGCGSTFSIRLPANAGRWARARRPAVIAPPAGNETARGSGSRHRRPAGG